MRSRSYVLHMNVKAFVSLFEMLSQKTTRDARNMRVSLGIRVIPNALDCGTISAIVEEVLQPGFITLTAYYPLDRPAYLAALSSQGIVRFNLSNLNSNRNIVVTGGVGERESRYYLYAILDTPLALDNRKTALGELYRLMDILAEYLNIKSHQIYL